MATPKKYWRRNFNLSRGGVAYNGAYQTVSFVIDDAFGGMAGDAKWRRLRTFPIELYPTKEDLPVRCAEIELYPELNLQR